LNKTLIPQRNRRRLPDTGFTLIEIATSLIILAVLAAMLVPLATTLLDSQRASKTEDDLNKIYTAIVGDPKQSTYGYLGDVGAFPSSLMDLVQSPGVSGWNGPYVSGATIDTSTGTSQIYDSFGSPVEYYVFSAAATANLADQLALVSRGPDHSSTNAATNPNVNQGAPPAVTTGSNADNVVVPHFFDNYNLSYYQSLGKLNINILNFDDNPVQNAVMPGCANYFDVKVASIPRNATEAWVNYNPGGASFDLIQGLYRVSVVVAGSASPVWQEQVTITPDNTVTRDVTLSGVNSLLTSTLALQIVNGLGANLQFYAGPLPIGTVNAGMSGSLTAVTSCLRILARNASTNTIIDSFLLPNGPAGMTRRYNANATCALTFANQTYNAIAIYEDNLLIGTVGKRGNKRAKSFTVRAGDNLTFKDETNTPQTATGFSNPVACPPAGTATF
jgi:prepilin-type N-terminal cleavage/methylation domain-containing protein